jgi:choline kinase
MTRPSDHRIGKSFDLSCVILAAGTSTRLRPLTDDAPKCLLEVGGKTILERAIRNVRSAGVENIAIVIGYKEEKIREFIARRFAEFKFHFILNARYEETNNAYSLWLARHFAERRGFRNGLLLLDGDILFSSKVLPCLLAREPAAFGRRRHRSPGDADGIAAVRRKGRHDSEEVRVSVDVNDFITAIGKGIGTSELDRESIGIEFFSARAVKKLFEILSTRMKNRTGKTEFYEATFQQMIEEGTMLRAWDVGSFPAIEIDTPADLRRARALHLD